MNYSELDESLTDNMETAAEKSVDSSSDTSEDIIPEIAEEGHSETPIKKVTVVEPFKYHEQLRDNYKKRKKTWDWFSEKANKDEQTKAFRSELLKNTYRLDKESHSSLYDIVDKVCEKLSIDAGVTLYQENNSTQLNAGISILDKEAHIVLSGNLLSLLNETELKALLGHELSHYLFYKLDDESYEITQRIILALANDSRSEDVIIETARIFQLYMELFCDLGSFKVCGDYRPVIQTLVKMNTGITQVNADSYVKQAEEILSSGNESTQAYSHPETYVRSIALKLYAEDNEDYQKNLEKLIEGSLDLNKLDIFRQLVMKELTEDLLQCLVKPSWMNSSAVMNLCKSYFEDFYKKETHKSLTEIGKQLKSSKESVKKYISYVLLDFAKVDSSLETAPLGFTLEIAELLSIRTFYEKLIRKELKLTVRNFKKLKDQAMAELQQVKESKDESLFSE
ncbi:MAG: M48 family metalloprotease [Lentisphaerales bacterium]|nr:M48 family metalloprotease [Lentisphaerales bacterium]